MALTLLMVLAAAVVACDRFSSAGRIGVSMDGDRLVILYPGCDYERVAAVHLSMVNDPGDQNDDDVLWELRSDEDSHGGVFIVGDEPEGYSEVVPFTATLDEDEPLVVWVESTAIGATIEFRMADLEPGMVWVHENPKTNISREVFEERAAATCRRDD
jgi:hypothetical protein